jgi:hypothetical protein
MFDLPPFPFPRPAARPLLLVFLCMVRRHFDNVTDVSEEYHYCGFDRMNELSVLLKPVIFILLGGRDIKHFGCD